MHSNASDGIFSPRELIKIAAGAGLAAAGLTDHDTVDGLAEAEKAAKTYGIELVPGVELSIHEENREVHIIGYYPGYPDQLMDTLMKLRRQRQERMEAMVDKLRKLGLKVTPEEVAREAGNDAPGRLHLARVMLGKKYIAAIDEAFSLYLNRNRPGFVPRRSLSLKEAMSLLADVKAIPVLAHPGSEGKYVPGRLIPLGLKGIEVYHPDHGAAQIKYYRRLALEKGLLITGGSDFHGDGLKGRDFPVHLAVSGCYLDCLKNMIRQ